MILGYGIIKGPERTALKFLMTRVTEFLDSFIDVTSWESLCVHKLNDKIRGRLYLSFFVGFNATSHILPVGSDTGNG